ncbi:MAG: alcohol dehydrogenase catalytic domain-containing protein [Planctomycetes bacterium]|nr:alcohol dehydrogenase catalytic domain-containing protein [Planctomycetota bacterium]
MGHQIVGSVEAMGDAAHRFAEGDRVAVAWIDGTDCEIALRLLTYFGRPFE